MDPQCNGASLFIDLVLQVDRNKNRREKEDHDHHRRIASKDNCGIRSSVIWFLKNSLCIWDLSRSFLMYVVSGFGEEFCNLDPLHKTNMI